MKKRFLMLFMMLLLSALVVTAAGYAWFTASAQSEIHGTQVRAETQGVLKVWTENDGNMPNTYDSYTTFINFADEDDPFYNPGYTDYAMKDQSGNGSLFYQTESAGPYDKYAEVSGRGVALVYNLYFSAYTGATGEDPMTRDIFLSDLKVLNVGTGTLANSIRIAFLDANNKVFGVANPHSSHDKFVTTTDYNTSNGGKVADYPPTGLILSSESTDPDSPDPLNPDPLWPGGFVDEEVYIAPADANATTVRKIGVGTTIAQIDARDVKADTPTMKVVIWIEGSDSNTTDAKLSHAVKVDMIFQSRVASNLYSLITSPNGGAHSNPATIDTFATGYWTVQAEAAAGDPGSGSYVANGALLEPATKSGFTFGGWRTTSILGSQLTKVYINVGEGASEERWLLLPGSFPPANRTLTVYANFGETE